jgi:hypothetical protein
MNNYNNKRFGNNNYEEFKSYENIFKAHKKTVVISEKLHPFK